MFAGGPIVKSVESGAQRGAGGSQCVLHPWGYLWVGGALDHPVDFECSQLLDEHLLCDAGDGPLQIREAAWPLDEQMMEDQQLPPAFDHPDGPLDPVDAAFDPRLVLIDRSTYFIVGTSHIGSVGSD